MPNYSESLQAAADAVNQYEDSHRVANVDGLTPLMSQVQTYNFQPGQPLADTSSVAPETDAIEFRVIRVGAPVRRLRLTGNRYTFGSAEGCSIRLSDGALRPMHAVLIRDASRVLVRAYSVPIEINGTRRTEASLQVGDKLRLGSYQFELLMVSRSRPTVLPSQNPDASPPPTAKTLDSSEAQSSPQDVNVIPEIPPGTSSFSTGERSIFDMPAFDAPLVPTDPNRSIDSDSHAEHMSSLFSGMRRDAPPAEEIIWRERLRREVEQWRERQVECDRRESRIDERESDLRGRESELWTRAENLYKREARVQSQEASTFQLYDEFTQRQHELLKLREETQSRQEEFNRREAEFRGQEFEYRRRLDEATRQLEQSQHQAETATEAVQRVREQFQSLNAQIEELSGQQSQIETRERQQREEHERLRAELEVARDEAVEAQSQSEIRRNEAEARVEEMAAQIEALQAGQGVDLQEQQEKLEESEQLVSQLRDQVAELQKTVAQASEESSQLRIDYEGACESVRKLETLVSQSSQRGDQDRESWAAEADELRSAIDELSLELARANGELSELREANAAMSARLENVQRERDEAVADVESRPSQEAFQSLREELDSANEQLSQMKRDYDDTLTRLGEVEAERQREAEQRLQEEAQRQQEEAQREQEEAQRQQEEAQRLQQEEEQRQREAEQRRTAETSQDVNASVEGLGTALDEADNESISSDAEAASPFDQDDDAWPVYESPQRTSQWGDDSIVESNGSYESDASAVGSSATDESVADESATNESVTDESVTGPESATAPELPVSDQPWAETAGVDSTEQVDSVPESTASEPSSWTSETEERKSQGDTNTESAWGSAEGEQESRLPADDLPTMQDSHEAGELQSSDDSQWGESEATYVGDLNVAGAEPEAAEPATDQGPLETDACEAADPPAEENGDSEPTYQTAAWDVASDLDVDSELNADVSTPATDSPWDVSGAERTDSPEVSEPSSLTGDESPAVDSESDASVWNDSASSVWDESGSDESASQSDQTHVDSSAADAAETRSAWESESAWPESEASQSADQGEIEPVAHYESEPTAIWNESNGDQADPLQTPEMTSVWEDAPQGIDADGDPAGMPEAQEYANPEDAVEDPSSVVDGSLASMLIHDLEKEAAADSNYSDDGHTSSWDEHAQNSGWDREYAEESRASEWTNDPDGFRVEQIEESTTENYHSDVESHEDYGNAEYDSNAAEDSVGYTDQTQEEIDSEVEKTYEIDTQASEPGFKVAEDSQHESPSDVQDAATVPAEDGDLGDEDSIEAYMNRLLNRAQADVRTESEEDETVSVSTSLSSSDLSETSESQAHSGEEHADSEMIDPDAPLVPRSHAPEKNSDLSAMRELANASARSAISRSVRVQTRDTQIKGAINFACAFGAAVCGVACFIFIPGIVRFLAVGMTAVVAVIYVMQGNQEFAEAKRRLTAAESGVADPDGDDTLDQMRAEREEASETAAIQD